MWHTLLAYDVMTKADICVDINNTLKKAYDISHDKGNLLVVLNNQKVAGLIDVNKAKHHVESILLKTGYSKSM